MRALSGVVFSILGALVLVTCTAAPAPHVPSGPDPRLKNWQWIAVEGSVCASGATAGFGLNVPTATDGGVDGGVDEVTDLFLYLQGGGACWNTGSCVPSLVQYGPTCGYGSLCALDVIGGGQPMAYHVTEHDPFPADGGGAFPKEIGTLNSIAVFDRADPTNPFRDAAFIYVPYCTGDLHAGNAVQSFPYRRAPLDPFAHYEFHFAGATNMDAYLARLKTLFPHVKRVWLTGSSAGGYGATFNFERVLHAFPGAELSLLADSAPFLPTDHWEDMKREWSLALPENCADCDQGMPEVIEHLARTYPGHRMGLLAYDHDTTVTWFFYSPPGLAYLLTPPTGIYAHHLAPLLERYEGHDNTRYFVPPGTDHVLWGGYGSILEDGGHSEARTFTQADGGTADLREWINGWATGDGGWSNARR